MIQTEVKLFQGCRQTFGGDPSVRERNLPVFDGDPSDLKRNLLPFLLEEITDVENTGPLSDQSDPRVFQRQFPQDDIFHQQRQDGDLEGEPVCRNEIGHPILFPDDNLGKCKGGTQAE